MRIFKISKKRMLIYAFAGGLVSNLLYKLYLYANNREQFEDSNILVSLVFVLIVTAFIYLILKLVSNTNSSK